MRIFFVILLGFISFSCSVPKALYKENNLLTISYTSEEEYLRVRKNYRNSIVNDSSIIKVDGIIKIPVSNGYKYYKDKIRGEEDEQMEEFFYLGRENEIGISIIGVGYWEDSKVIIVDNDKGEAYDFWADPYVSPDKRKLACFLSYGLEGYPVGIQIWRVQENNYYKLDKLIELSQKQWNPIELCWAGANTLLLKVRSFSGTYTVNPALAQVFYLKLEIRDSIHQ